MSVISFTAYSYGNPDGVAYSASDLGDARVQKERLAKSGWVDDPAKLGINPWGDRANEHVAKAKSDFDAGRVQAFDPPSNSPPPDAYDEGVEKAKAAQEAQDSVRTTHDVMEETRRKMESARDEARDLGMDPDTVAPAPPPRKPETVPVEQTATAEETEPQADAPADGEAIH